MKLRSLHARLIAGKTALRFERSGYVALSETVDVAAAMKPVEVALQPRVIVSGRVVDSKGASAAGELVGIDSRTIRSASGISSTAATILRSMGGLNRPARQRVRSKAGPMTGSGGHPVSAELTTRHECTTTI